MAARKNGIVVPTRERPVQSRFRVSGNGPGGRRVEFIVEQATDPADAIWQARKRAALTGWEACPA